MNENTLGERILELLKKYNMTQRQLADIVGTTEVSICRYVKGERIPRGPVIANIAKALHTTSDYLLGTEDVADFESEYYTIHQLIVRNASKMSFKQKRQLLNALFESDEQEG